jgi:peptide/nickel transport system ATP-binding protein
MTNDPGDAPAVSTGPPLLAVRDLTVTIDLETGPATAVDGISFGIDRGQILGMVGESGSGKSMTAHAITRMLPAAARTSGGQVTFDGQDLTTADKRTMRQVRGGSIGMVFQDPLASLNPLMTVGAQISEALRLHGSSRATAAKRAVELLDLVGITNPGSAVHDRPHEFSGGMRQRVMIAMAIANNPKLLIADEPTTALDVTIQAEVLGLLTRLRDEFGMAIMLISHDIAIIEQVCDRVVVLYGGRIAETGRRSSVLSTPRHPYTYQLMQSVPRLAAPVQRRLYAIGGQPPDISQGTQGCRFMPRCEFAEQRCTTQPPLRPGPGTASDHLAACWVISEPGRQFDNATPAAPAEAADRAPDDAVPPPGTEAGSPSRAAGVLVIDKLAVDYRRGGRRPGRQFPAVDSVSLTVSPGRTLGLVGESGSGKTTVARAALGLVRPTSGSVTVAGMEWHKARGADRARMRAAVQLVFQDPYASLNPRWRVRQIVAEPLGRRPPGQRADPADLLQRVGLPVRFLDRYPDELSGGQRQRVGIARALACEPEILIADEPVSALDVSVQAQVINLLTELRDDLGVGLVFIAHDLAVVRHVSDDLAVMYRGRIVEQGPAEAIFTGPRHPYTAVLMASAPGQPTAATAMAGALPVAASRPPADSRTGCRFRDRCPAGPLLHPERTVCTEQDPQLDGQPGSHRSACHFPDEAQTWLSELPAGSSRQPEFARSDAPRDHLIHSPSSPG